MPSCDIRSSIELRDNVALTFDPPRAFVLVSLCLAVPGVSATFSRSLFIKVETTPNPDSMKFVPDGNRVVLPEKFGTGVHFSDAAAASGCKFAKRLLKYSEITSVFLGRDFVSVNKKEDASWAPLRPLVLDALMDAFAEADEKAGKDGGKGEGGFIIEEMKPSQDTVITEEDDEVVAMIKELLETRIRPAVQEDGGDIFYQGFDPETGIVKLKMAGSCVGCPSSTATLRNGVENMLTHYIPEVKGIEQIKGEEETKGEQEFEELEKKLNGDGKEGEKAQAKA